jgi:hypothetical protein
VPRHDSAISRSRTALRKHCGQTSRREALVGHLRSHRRTLAHTGASRACHPRHDTVWLCTGAGGWPKRGERCCRRMRRQKRSRRLQCALVSASSAVFAVNYRAAFGESPSETSAAASLCESRPRIGSNDSAACVFAVTVSPDTTLLGLHFQQPVRLGCRAESAGPALRRTGRGSPEVRP